MATPRNYLESLYNSWTDLDTADYNPQEIAAHVSRAVERFLSGQTTSFATGKAITWRDTLNNYLTLITNFTNSRSSLENTSIVLAICTFLFLAMSWTSRLGSNLGRFSPFARSPTQAGSTQVSDADFSYITTDDLRRNQIQSDADSTPQDLGPPRDTDVLIVKHKRMQYPVHFPAYSIAKGELNVGQLRDAVVKKTGAADAKRVKLLYKGSNLKDDHRSCRSAGLKDHAELLCTIGDGPAPSESGSDSEDDEDEEGIDGRMEGDGDTGKRRRNRNRNKKRRQKAKGSGTSTPAGGADGSTPSPKPAPSPATPLDKLNALQDTLRTFAGQVDAYERNPPTETGKFDFEHKRLSETILAQVLLKLDAVETEGDQDARARRKALVKDAQAELNKLDAAHKRGSGQ